MNLLKLSREDVLARAEERGYTAQEVEPCFIRALEGSLWEVDVDSPAYPKPRTGWAVPSAEAKPSEAPPRGPGTEMKKLLAMIGITASPNCSCNAFARQMDAWGPDECAKPERMAEILTRLEEQAKGRNLPFVRFGAEQAVKLAIRRARKTARP